MEINERNSRIIHLRSQGISRKNIAKEFELTIARIDQILSRYKSEKEIEKRSADLLKQSKQSDDLDKKWPLTDLINALHLSARTRNLVIKYFISENETAISLNELIVSITPKDSVSKYALTSVPIIKQKGLWKKLFREIVHQLSVADFGDAFNALWENRKNQILRAAR